MGYTDFSQKLDTARAATALTGGVTTYSLNSIDLGVARDIGQGSPQFFLITIPTTFATSTSATLNVGVAVGTDVTPGGGGGVLNAGQVILSNTAYALAALAAGKRYYIPIPPQVFDPQTGAASIGKRYLAASYFVGAGTSFTAGAISVEVVDQVQDGTKAYPIGYTTP